MSLNHTISKIRYTRTYFCILLAGLLITSAGAVKAQSVGFVQQDVIRKPGVQTDADIGGLSAVERQTTRSFYDGLGQTIQEVAVKGSPDQKDIIQPFETNNLGQQAKSYLPYVGTDGNGAYRPNALVSEQAAFYTNSLPNKIAADAKPYSQQYIENSPLQRLLNAGSVGNGFQIGEHSKGINYRSNSSGDGNIIKWGPTGTNDGNYAVSVLSVNEVTDEELNKSAVFSDLAGHPILKRQYTATAGVYLDTYYIYNNAGMISYIVPPKALAIMVAGVNYSLTQTGVDKLVFKFLYDNQGRQIQKTISGTGVVNTVYDPLNRPVLVQDAKMAASYKWYYIKYDGKGHPISQGIYTDPGQLSATAMQSAVTGNTTYNTYWYETRSGITYTNNCFPNTAIIPLSYTYYDNYDLDNNGVDDYSYTAQSFTGVTEGSQTTAPVRGVPTMIRRTVIGSGYALGAGPWLVSYMFYDRQGRVIQVRSNNLVNNSTANDISTSVPDFAGATLQAKVVKVVGSTTTTVLSVMKYDHAYRLKAVEQKYNAGAQFQVAAYEYNAIGQLVDKKLHSTNAGYTKFMQSIDYRYNIRGQLLSINNSKLNADWGTGTGYTNTDDSANEKDDLFGMQFLYEQNDTNLGNTGYYNGRLSAIKWMSKDGSNVKSYERSYKYTYDLTGRFTAAGYQERTATGTGAFNNNVGGFDESGITYDENGNIKTLNRNSSTQGTNTNTPVDRLTYTYKAANPNQLDNVTDAATGANTYGFKNYTGTAANSTYTYDVNGNMTADPFKGLSITYNELNRTNVITITTGTNKHIDYTYDAGGALVRKQQYDNTNPVVTTDYIDGFVYINSVLSYFPMPEGRARNTGSSLKPEYIISDQQGSARISFEESATLPGTPVVRQENSYYAFGLSMANSPLGSPAIPNKQLYNGGSEWQNDYGDLPDLQQTFYRNYDAALGRFVGVDPMAEATESMSTYQYANNNPVMMNDPMGDYATPPGAFGSGFTSAQAFRDAYKRAWGETGQEMNEQEARFFGSDVSTSSGIGGGGGDVRNDGRWISTGESGLYYNNWVSFKNSMESNYGKGGNYAMGKNGTIYYQTGVLIGDPNATNGIGYRIASHTINDGANQGGGPMVFIGAAALSTGWTAEGLDPEPVSKVIGAIGMGIYTGYVISQNKEYLMNAAVSLYNKMTAEIDRIAQKAQGPQGFTYALVAKYPGLYPNVRGGTTFLNVGDVWKFGQTTSGSRYSGSYLEGAGLRKVDLFSGSQMEIKIQEKIMIYGYFMQNGTLPPGNSIFR
jgi:RHS repeat-associated protein